MNEQLAVRVTTNVQRRYAFLRRGAWRLLRTIAVQRQRIAELEAELARLRYPTAYGTGDVLARDWDSPEDDEAWKNL